MILEQVKIVQESCCKRVNFVVFEFFFFFRNFFFQLKFLSKNFYCQVLSCFIRHYFHQISMKMDECFKEALWMLIKNFWSIKIRLFGISLSLTFSSTHIIWSCRWSWLITISGSAKVFRTWLLAAHAGKEW